MTNTAYDKLNSMVEKIISKIESGETGSWFKPWIGAGLPTNFASKTMYNGFNILSLLYTTEENEYKTNYWLTFNQLKKLGGKLNKGSVATPVFFFKPIEVNEENDEGETIKKTIPLLKFYNVFNLDQTNLELGNIENSLDLSFEEFISNTNVSIKQAGKAFYSPSNDYIGMPHISLFDSVDSYKSVLLHELAHSTGHENRLNRDLSGTFGSESYAKEELIAELSSMFLSSHLGIKSKIRHEAYLENWLQAIKAEPKLLWKSASEAQKVFDYLLGLQQTQQKAA